MAATSPTGDTRAKLPACADCQASAGRRAVPDHQRRPCWPGEGTAASEILPRSARRRPTTPTTAGLLPRAAPLPPAGCASVWSPVAPTSRVSSDTTQPAPGRPPGSRSGPPAPASAPARAVLGLVVGVLAGGSCARLPATPSPSSLTRSRQRWSSRCRRTSFSGGRFAVLEHVRAGLGQGQFDVVGAVGVNADGAHGGADQVAGGGDRGVVAGQRGQAQAARHRPAGVRGVVGVLAVVPTIGPSNQPGLPGWGAAGGCRLPGGTSSAVPSPAGPTAMVAGQRANPIRLSWRSGDAARPCRSGGVATVAAGRPRRLSPHAGRSAGPAAP
jgi:hypothetical protein